MFKSKTFILLMLLAASAVLSCAPASVNGQRADALEDSAWESSKWISVVDAPVVTLAIRGKIFRGPSGSSLATRRS